MTNSHDWRRFKTDRLPGLQTYDDQHIIDYIKKTFPELKERLAEGKPGEYMDGKVFRLDASKSEKELGIKYHSFEDCISDTVRELLEVEKRVKA